MAFPQGKRSILPHLYYKHMIMGLLLMILTPFEVYSQLKQDSLVHSLQSYPQIQHDSIYYELFKLSYKKDVRRGQHYAKKAMEMARKNGHVSLYAQACYAMAYLHNLDQKPEPAIHYYHKALHQFETLNNAEKVVQIYNELGWVFDQQDIYDSALYFFTLSKEKAIASKLFYNQAIAIQNVGIIHQRITNFSEAIANFKEAIDIKRAHGISQDLDLNLLNLVSAYNDAGSFDSAVAVLHQVEVLCLSGCRDDTPEYLFYERGYAHFKQGLKAEAHHYFLQAQELVSKSNNTSLMGHIYYHFALLACDQNNYGEAIESLHKAEKLATKENIKRLKRDIYQQLALLYQKIQDPGKELVYQKLYIQFSDSLFNEKISTNLKNIALASEQRETQKAIQEKEDLFEASIITIALAGGSLLLILIVCYFIYKALMVSRRRKKEMEIEVRKRISDLERSNYELRTMQTQYDKFIQLASIDTHSQTREMIQTLAKLDYNDVDRLKHVLKETEPLLKGLMSQVDMMSKFELVRGHYIHVEQIDIPVLLGDVCNLYNRNLRINLNFEKGKETILLTDKRLLHFLFTHLIETCLHTIKENNNYIHITYEQGRAFVTFTIKNNIVDASSYAFENYLHMLLLQTTASRLKGYVRADTGRNGETVIRVSVLGDLTESADFINKHLLN